MRNRSFTAVVAAGVLVAALVAPATAVAKGKKSAGPVVVGEDPEGDWGSNVDPTIGAIGDALAQDLIEAAIGMADAKTINFIIKVTGLPSNGGVPEFTRYTWQMLVDGEDIELDGKWTNYTRGTYDPTSNGCPSDPGCPPPGDPGPQPFLVRGNCASNGAAVACEVLGKVQAEFDASAGTITIPVPMTMIEAKPGTVIAHAVQADSGFSGVSAAPSAWYSHSSAPYDTLSITKEFVVPGKAKKKGKK